jgi:hypothetical protein
MDKKYWEIQSENVTDDVTNVGSEKGGYWKILIANN